MHTTISNLLSPLTAYVVDTYIFTDPHSLAQEPRLTMFGSIQAVFEVRESRGDLNDVDDIIAVYSKAISGATEIKNPEIAEVASLVRIGLYRVREENESDLSLVFDIVRIMNRIYVKGRKITASREVLRDFMRFYVNAPSRILAALVARFDFEFSMYALTNCNQDNWHCLPTFKINDSYARLATELLKIYPHLENGKYLMAGLYSTYNAARYLGRELQLYAIRRYIKKITGQFYEQDSVREQIDAALTDFYKVYDHNQRLSYAKTAPHSANIQPLIMFVTNEVRQANPMIKPHTVENKINDLACENKSWKSLVEATATWAMQTVGATEVTKLLAETYDTAIAALRAQFVQDHVQKIAHLAVSTSQLACIENICQLYYGVPEFDAYAAKVCGLTLGEYLNGKKVDLPQKAFPAITSSNADTLIPQLYGVSVVWTVDCNAKHQSAPKLPCVNTSNAAALIPEIYGVPVLWVKAQQARLNDLPVGYMPSAKIDAISYVNNGNRAAVKFDVLVLVYPDNTPVLFDRKGIWLGVKQLEDIVLTAAHKPHVEREAIYGENATLLDEAPVVATEGICERCQAVTHVIDNVCYDCSNTASDFRQTISESDYLCGQWIESQVDTIPLAPKLDTLTVNDIEEISRILYEYYGLRLRLRAIDIDVKNAVFENNDVVYAFYRRLVVCYNFNNEMLRFDAKTRRLDIAQLKRILNSMGG